MRGPPPSTKPNSTANQFPVIPGDAFVVAGYTVCSLRKATRASSQGSVPVEFGHRQVLVKAFVWEVVISFMSEVIARITRLYNPLDIGKLLPVIEKRGAVN